MELRLFLTTFATIFLAELGDKTQLATMGFAASTSARWTVFLAASLALVLSSLLGVLVGGTFAQHVSPHFIRRAAGSLFIVIGIWLWVGR